MEKQKINQLKSILLGLLNAYPYYLGFIMKKAGTFQ